MAFASAWLEERTIFPVLFDDLPDQRTGIIIVIPSFSEPDIAGVLNSLSSCARPSCIVEVIILVNAPSSAGDKHLGINEKTVSGVASWIENNKESFLRVYCHNTGKSAYKEWGVGMARKTGMDEALRRFNRIGKRDGLIVCLDADCRVEENYLSSLYAEVYSDTKCKSCTIRFEHPVQGNEYPQEIYDYVAGYELHLRYMRQGLVYAGFPYPLHTIGSAMAVKAETYMKIGGMNRRQAGEDFYFIQKLVQIGGIKELKSTMVLPSPRRSFRVPFGTGAAIGKMADNKHDTTTYNIGSYIELRSFFKSAALFAASSIPLTYDAYERFPPTIKSFISWDEIFLKTEEIRSNTSGSEKYIKRFYSWFNMFRIVKYLNHCAERGLEKQAVKEAALQLLEMKGEKLSGITVVELLEYYRNLDANTVIHFP